jgi:hypothetical protein
VVLAAAVEVVTTLVVVVVTTLVVVAAAVVVVAILVVEVGAGVVELLSTCEPSNFNTKAVETLSLLVAVKLIKVVR